MTEEVLREAKELNDDIREITNAIDHLSNRQLCIQGYWCNRELTDKVRAMLITEQERLQKRFSEL